MAQTRTTLPQADELWLARPPYLMLARVLSAEPQAEPPTVEYELLDDDGRPLTAPVSTELDPSWWRIFQPLLRRHG